MTDSFHVASDADIRSGRATDASLTLANELLQSESVNPSVVAEVRASDLPRDWTWAVFAGLDEAIHLLEGRALHVDSVAEGTVFYAEEPVLVVAGPYQELAVVETALVGLLSQESGIATAAARLKAAAQGRPVYSFGSSRVHPAIVPAVERAAYVGGCDGVTAARSAAIIERDPVATMGHDVVLLLGEERAWLALDGRLDHRQPRIVMVGTAEDEKRGALAAVRTLRDRLAGIRIDTPASRRGNLTQILRELRWELDVRGFGRVQLFVSAIWKSRISSSSTGTRTSTVSMPPSPRRRRWRW
ncbi:MAG: nicotinate phosphoribosyltransferase [Actinomycetota bacterium]